MEYTNTIIRRFLRLPSADRELTVNQVDSLGVRSNTLMFINKAGVDLSELDKSSDSIFLIDEDYYPEFSSERNDFIRVKNPKYKFCKIVSVTNLPSTLQNTFNYNKGSLIETGRCLELIVGDNCHFDEGTIIGGTDFSPVVGDDPEELVQFPQMGGVKIGNNVVIKYHSMVGKGTFGYTEIGDYTMIDYGCQVGHNCIVGKNCIMAAGVIIGGSTIIGDHTVIGIGAYIRNNIRIGKNVSIGMGTVVTKDIPDNCVVVGNPARIIEHKPIFDKGGLI